MITHQHLYTPKSLVCVLLLLASYGLKAQEGIDRTVQVIRPYEPVLTQAQKINLMPRADDTMRVRPDFQYNLVSKKLVYNFEPRPLTAAKMVAVPFPKLYKSYLTMGIGNHSTPMAEFYYNSLQAKQYNFGLYLQHYSSSGKVKLDDNQKVYAGAARNKVELFGNYFFDKHKLTGNVGYLRQGHHQYGYNTVLYDTILNRDDIKQVYSGVYAALRLNNLTTDTADIHFNSGLNYQYFFDKYTSSEHAIKFDAGFDKIINANKFGVDFYYNYYGFSSTIDSGGFNSFVKISPYFSKNGNDWKFLVGGTMIIRSYDFDSQASLHPRAEFQFNIVEKVLVPYLGAGGGVEENSFSKIALENPFMRPDSKVANSINQFDAYAGIKGNYTEHLAFDLRVAYGITKDMYFFINDTLSAPGNFMDVLYDDAELSAFYASFTYTGKPFSLTGRFGLYGYKLQQLDKPWHKPDYTVDVASAYSLNDKIIVSLGMQLTGNRYAPVFNTPGQSMIKLKAVADFNLGVEYRYTKILSGFVRFSNISTSKYYLYQQYPGFGFQVMAGFTYSL